MPEPLPVQVDVIERLDDRLVLGVAGEIEHASSEAFRDAVLALHTPQTRHLILDFTTVPFWDSSGIKALVALAQHTRDNGGRLVIIHPTGQLLRVLQMTGLHDLITTHPTLATAVAALSEHRDADR